MTKLHELLAVEGNLAAAYNVITDETQKLLARPDAFVRERTQVRHFAEEDVAQDQEATKAHTTTVPNRLEYQLGNSFRRYIDLLVTKDATNQIATGDVEIDGKVLLPSLPATALLTLETKLGELRKVLDAAPTLQAAHDWEFDASEDMHRLKEPQVTFRTRKTVKGVILAPATDKHPAQVEKVTEDVPIARIEKMVWSGMLTSAEKSTVLGRLDHLIVAVKQARQRANRTDIEEKRVGSVIAAYLLNGEA